MGVAALHDELTSMAWAVPPEAEKSALMVPNQ
jgi:hypothetical protein